MPRVLVVGAGIAGLAAAHALRARRPDVELRVLEGGQRVGGLVRTERMPGYVVERGPESILSDRPAGMGLIDRLGLSGELISTQPEHRGAFVVAHGRLERIPAGFQLLAPLDIQAFLASPILSPAGKARALADLVLPGKPSHDESLASFVRRRFGDELLDRLAQPLVSGIYGADPSVLSLRATMPRFLDAEARAGSVIRGLQEAARDTPAHGARYSLFVNFRRGMMTLAEGLERDLHDTLEFGASVLGLERVGAGYVVHLEGGRTERADGLVLAAGGPTTASLARGLDTELAALLGQVRHGSGAIVTLALRREQIGHPLDAYGYVTPTIEGRRATASTFLSRKWPGRAPEGIELVRFFFGRDGDDAVASLPEDELVRLARSEAAALLDARGEPLFTRVDVWHQAMPRYGVGHVDLADAAEARLTGLPGFGLAGNTLRGVGLPDSIASGERAAARVVEHLDRLARGARA